LGQLIKIGGLVGRRFIDIITDHILPAEIVHQYEQNIGLGRTLRLPRQTVSET
jgi:hypothetical protein